MLANEFIEEIGLELCQPIIGARAGIAFAPVTSIPIF
jgi:hypothetical protein